MIQLRRKPLKSLGCLLLLFTLITINTVKAEVEVEWFNDADVSIGYNNNIGQAKHSRDITSDYFAVASYALISNIELDDSKAISFKAFVEYEGVDTVEDLSHSVVGAQFAYRWQNTLGYLAPFYQFNTSIQLNEYGVNQRDSTVSKTQFFITKRFSDSITVVSGIAHYIEDSEGTVFDLDHNRIFFSLDYRPGHKSIYYTSYGYRKGDIWSNAQFIFCNGKRADDIFPLIKASKANEPDEAFNNAFCGQWMAYRLEADTHTVSLGANFAIGKSSALDLSAVWVDSQVTKDINYQSTIFRASFLTRF